MELLRSRLTGLGAVPARVLADDLSLPRGDIDIALLRLQGEGYAMQGRFSPGAAEDEWCERHLLARIHRYTLKRLRREIEPVEPRDFMRFLFDWQRVSPATRVSGPEALEGVLAQLEGFEAPASAWETELLPARMLDYSITWLDDLCTAGRTLWTRLRANSCEEWRTRHDLGARHAGRAAAATQRADVDTPGAAVGGRRNAVVASAARGRLPRRARRVVLRRAGDGRALAAHRAGRCAGRTGRTRPRALRQLRRPACVAGAGIEATERTATPASPAPRCSASRMRAAGH